VTQLIKSLMNEIRSTTISYKSESQSVELLISNLKSVITNFKVKAQSNSSLTTDEAKVLMLFAEFQYNSISETVSLVLSFDSTSSSGRTEGWFSSLISCRSNTCDYCCSFFWCTRDSNRSYCRRCLWAYIWHSSSSKR
jgi:hypothetical protein